MKYCNKCLLPDTKPDLYFDSNGVCSACLNYEARKNINWDERKSVLIKLVSSHKTGKDYDCIIPVSGGKDSHFQTITALELGLHPLCVTASTDDLSSLGRKNIENLKHLGMDYIEISTNPVVRRKINKIALQRVGDISWPEHVTIFTIPIRIAVQMNIPLILWGENPQNEYGGPLGTQGIKQLDNGWLQEFGGLLGLRVSDFLEDGFTEKDLIQYRYPPMEQMSGLSSIFLGNYIPWDGKRNAEIAREKGFTFYDKTVEGSFVEYENLDNYQTGIHDFFKFLKFGFGRATDIASMWVRRGYCSRKDAAVLIKSRDGKFPWNYLGKSLGDILTSIDMNFQEFLDCCEKFCNWDLFKNRGVMNLEKKQYAE